jgi:hypothetical protein
MLCHEASPLLAECALEAGDPAVLDHARGCPACGRELEALRRTVGKIKAALPTGDAERAAGGGAPSAEPRPLAPVRRGRPAAWGIFALVLLALVSRHGPPPGEPAAPAPTERSAPATLEGAPVDPRLEAPEIRDLLEAAPEGDLTAVEAGLGREALSAAPSAGLEASLDGALPDDALADEVARLDAASVARALVLLPR